MIVSLDCVRANNNVPYASLGIESMPGFTTYCYAPAWPQMLEAQPVPVKIETEPAIASAAASILKVASWANGYLSTRTWDTVSTPNECPEPGKVVADESSLSGHKRLPVYNCFSLPSFAVGLKTLNTLLTSIDWIYGETDAKTTGILRLLGVGRDPHVEAVSEGHWMIGLGRSDDVIVDSPNALEVLGANEEIALHVNGGDGPLLISRINEITEFYAQQCRSEMTTYRAIPSL